jgi:hypothetical protein
MTVQGASGTTIQSLLYQQNNHLRLMGKGNFRATWTAVRNRLAHADIYHTSSCSPIRVITTDHRTIWLIRAHDYLALYSTRLFRVWNLCRSESMG